MAKPKDRTGERYGKLVCLERGPLIDRLYQWKCQCDCGNIVMRSPTGLGKKSSCGCSINERLREQARAKILDLTGTGSGMLVYIGEAERAKHGGRRIKVRCGCGTEKVVIADSYISGEYKSCGCFGRHVRTQATHKRIDVTGEKYGMLTAIRFDHTHNQEAFWLFRCDCGGEYIGRLAGPRHGMVKSCGCLYRESARKMGLANKGRIKK